MRFSRPEYWSGLPCPSPGDLPDPGIEQGSPVAPAEQADSLPVVRPRKPKPLRGGQIVAPGLSHPLGKAKDAGRPEGGGNASECRARSPSPRSYFPF